ncbi:hypothetical protein BBJ28_00010848 [Nothophytophthora sp. Chile5]|nr:hypothetical protein BBJ28_00010848 [Nothophytophthora sp. Chile5]
MLTRVNKERVALGLPKLCHNSKLQAAAQRQSNDMAAKNFMSHTGSDSSTMSSRITSAGYRWTALGENVAAGQVNVNSVMTAWMNSPGHRANILGSYTMFGTAYAYNSGSTYKHYWTQDFGKGSTESCDSMEAELADIEEILAPLIPAINATAPSTETPANATV